MRYTELSTERPPQRRRDPRRRGESGQAIVLIGLMLLVLLGMVGLAVDGGRAYVDKREVQDAVDAGALAAGDNFLNSFSQSAAESAASREFAANMRITGSESDTSWGSDNASASWSGYPGTFNIQVSHNAFNGTNFTVAATHSLTLAFMQALNLGPQISVAGSARAVVMSQTQTPALLTLGQNGCPGGGNGNSLTIQGSSNVAIVGALYANGSIFAQSSSTQVTVAGNAFDNCGGVPGIVRIDCYNPTTSPPSDAGPVSAGCGSGTVPGAAYTGVPPLPDPGYLGADPAGLPLQPSPGSNIVLQPGVYNVGILPANSGCYFLAPGVYDWNGGVTANGGLYSNELKPPDEFVPGNDTVRASPNFWLGTGSNVQHCDGAFEVATVTSHGGGVKPLNPAGNWGIMITSVRQDTYNGVSYYRESAPSMCRVANNITGRVEGFQVAISNVPGAQSYNIYASPTGCGGPFGYAQSVINTLPESNSTTGGCPFLPPAGNPIAPPAATGAPQPAVATVNPACSLGYVVSDIIDSGDIGSGTFNVSSSYCGTSGPTPACQYPIGSPGAAGTNDGGEQPAKVAGIPQETPLKDILANGGGDRADEHECRPSTSSSTLSPCAGATVTPGAVQFYFPGPGSCFVAQGVSSFADWWIFGGIQYQGIVLYAPPSNTCRSMKLAGGSQTTVIGTIYAPSTSFNITGGAHTAVQGQVIVGNATIDGTSGTAITYDPGLSPPAPGAKLIL